MGYTHDSNNYLNFIESSETDLKLFRKKGFSLLDVMLAAVLLGTVVGGVNLVLQAYARSTARGRSLLVATHLAERVMERQLALGFDVVPLPRDPSRVFQMTQYSGEQVAQIEYWFSVDVVDLSDTTNNINMGLKRLTVTVGWNESRGERTVEASSLVYWNG